MDPSSQPSPQTPGARKSTLHRLGVYLFGIGIGLVLLGVFQVLKARAAQRPAQPAVTAPAGAPR